MFLPFLMFVCFFHLLYGKTRYLRLELLEGVVAYHSGNHEEARKALNSAQSKFNQVI